MSLQERTLVVKNFDPEKTTPNLLKELCLQSGPVRNVVIRPDHAFVEFEDVESVGYCKALLGNIKMFGKSLIMEPKIRTNDHLKYTKILQNYIAFDRQQQAMQKRQLQDQEALGQQQQMPVFSQQQAPSPAPYQHYGPQSINPSLPSPPVNFIPNTSSHMYNIDPSYPQVNSQYAQPYMYHPNLAPNILGQPDLQSFNTSRFQVPIQPGPQMYPPSAQIYNPVSSSQFGLNQTIDGNQYAPIPMPAPNSHNLNRSRSFNDHKHPQSRWNRRR